MFAGPQAAAAVRKRSRVPAVIAATGKFQHNIATSSATPKPIARSVQPPHEGREQNISRRYLATAVCKHTAGRPAYLASKSQPESRRGAPGCASVVHALWRVVWARQQAHQHTCYMLWQAWVTAHGRLGMMTPEWIHNKPGSDFLQPSHPKAHIKVPMFHPNPHSCIVFKECGNPPLILSSSLWVLWVAS
jgi:hypothetical protein